MELVTGRGRDYWPRPGRIFTTHRKHTFAQLAEAIDIAFGRWDLAHLRMFVLADGVEMSWSPWRDGPAFPGTRDGRCSRLDELTVGTVFAYVFDLGEDWTHLCTVGPLMPPSRCHCRRSRLGPTAAGVIYLISTGVTTPTTGLALQCRAARRHC
ncbi:hypothetical protein ABZ949_33515 [Micromonospora tulbaghiae]|uniref:IS1096 element passenger TnpR family protein n=1 Tax=Micromonospora tulbaghiae TaxID=479978 RepID=UPI003409E7F8